MTDQDLPEIGECVIATFRCGGPRIFHAFLSREDDGENIVWCQTYSPPRWNESARQWQSHDAEQDDEYEVLAWVRLPDPPSHDRETQ